MQKTEQKRRKEKTRKRKTAKKEKNGQQTQNQSEALKPKKAESKKKLSREKKKREKQQKKQRKKQGRVHFANETFHMGPGQMKKVIIWSVEIVAVCILAWTLVILFGQRVSNAGDSMSPVLKNGDIVLVDRMVYNAKKPSRGDVIAFKPNGNENAHYLVKRVVGLPGETVQIVDGQIYINGQIPTTGIFASEIESAGIASEPVQLGETEYFVIGDNHAGSDDSRMADVGNVQRSDIYGKVWFVASFGERFGFVED